MILFDDILYKKDVFYNSKTMTMVESLPELDMNIEIIDEPVIMMDTLHSCFSHAIVDSCFPIFWVVDDLLSNKIISNNKIRIFIKKQNILNYPTQNLPLINNAGNNYNGTWKDIIELVTDKPIIFEHLIKHDYLFKQVFIYPDNDNHQRSPWNCIDYYPVRKINRQDVRFKDEIIYNKLSKFRSHVLEKHLIANSNSSPEFINELIIIDRKQNRKLDDILLRTLITEANKNTKWTFKGVVVLEDLNFVEQINLFNSTRIFIFRHGSSLINLLWCKPYSIVFDLQGGAQGMVMGNGVIHRICKLTNSAQITLDYNRFDPKKNIFDVLEQFL